MPRFQATSSTEPGKSSYSAFTKGLLWTGVVLGSFIAGVKTQPFFNTKPENTALTVTPSQQPAQPETVSAKATTPVKLLEGFPAIEPYRTQMLKVSPLHTIYVEESGNPEGYPVIYLHGGPGSGLGKSHREFFDPKFFRIIAFEQRGCGRSTPYGELKENTTQDLIGDIEKIREQLGVKGKALIFGGSWGSLLSLAYAEAHPENTGGVIAWGISLGQRSQTSWSSHPTDGASNLLPEAGEIFERPLQGVELSEEDVKLGRDPYLGAYYRLFNDPNVPEEKLLKAVRDWKWSESMLDGTTLAELEAENTPLEAFRKKLDMARLVCHYYYHNAFMSPDDQLIRNVEKLRDVKHIFLINGREDMNTPPIRAFQMQRALEKAGIPSTTKIIEGAGHTSWGQPVAHELLTSIENFKTMVENTREQDR